MSIAYAWLLVYVAMGAMVGVLAGLLGVGGGLTLVPLLVMAFIAQGFPASTLMQVALATSMATIIFTSLSSVNAHYRQGAVNTGVVMAMVPGILLGAFMGAKVVSLLSSYLLSIFFTAFLFCVATQMLLGFKPKASRQLPGSGGLFLAGGCVGGLSALTGAGGGFFSVPFLTWRNMSMHQAIGTSAALGFPIAIFTTTGNLWQGWGAANVPPHTIGYIYWPALLCISVASVSTAPFGARLAHRLPVGTLRKIFAGILYLLAVRMLWTVTHF